MEIPKLVYFFSNLFFINMGLIFLLPIFFPTKEEFENSKKHLFRPVLHIYSGLIALILTIFMILFPSDNIPIFGDIIPAFYMIILSIILFFGYIRITGYLNTSQIKKGSHILTSLQIPAGIISIIIGVIHIFFDKILFL